MHSIFCVLLSLHILFYSTLSFIPCISTRILFSEAVPSTEESSSVQESSPAISISASSAVLMEASTGAILYEKDSHTTRNPASITKIMTLILIFEAIENKKISLTDVVTVSEHAASMGGSQVYLEVGETQTVETMIKCISIASANDASVAMAEYVSGSEESFVMEMNAKAQELGMKDTKFVNCCGLDTKGHQTSAYDVALMARELSVKHPQIHEYCTIWMDTITHTTAKGSSEFGLTNTNKLIRQYPYATGLKTGFTNEAKFCLAATGEKDGMKMISVVMGAESSAARSTDASALLEYGFAKCQIYTDENQDNMPQIDIKKGVKDSLPLAYKNSFQYLSVDGMDFAQIEKKINLPETMDAPVKNGDKVGEAVYLIGGKKLGAVDIVAAADVLCAPRRR